MPLSETSDDLQLQFGITVKSDSQSKNAAFPSHIAAASCRPDAVIWSDKLKTVVWIELTSPWEENMTKWHFRKHEKYNKLATAVRNKGWKANPLCVELSRLHWPQLAAHGQNSQYEKRDEQTTEDASSPSGPALQLLSVPQSKKPRVVTSTSLWCMRLITTTPRNYIGCNNLNKKPKKR